MRGHCFIRALLSIAISDGTLPGYAIAELMAGDCAIFDVIFCVLRV